MLRSVARYAARRGIRQAVGQQRAATIAARPSAAEKQQSHLAKRRGEPIGNNPRGLQANARLAIDANGGMSDPFTPVPGEPEGLTEAPREKLFYCCRCCGRAIFDLAEHFAEGDSIGRHTSGWPTCSSTIAGAIEIRPRDAKTLAPVQRANPSSSPAPSPSQFVTTGAAHRAPRKSLLVGDALSCRPTTTMTPSPIGLRQEVSAVSRAQYALVKSKSRWNYILNATRADPVVLQGHCRSCKNVVCRIFTKKGRGLVYVVEPRAVVCAARDEA